MKKWTVVVLLGSAQFVMVLDGTVMNVSISTIVAELDTSVSALQAAITFYTLTMASLMLLGAKLGDVWGRRRAFIIGSIVYAVGSLMTAMAPSFTVLFLGWSIVEGLGAVLVIPAIAALVADNYRGADRGTAYAIIGAISGAAVAAGPLLGGLITTYLSWRVVFVAEVVIMIVVVSFTRVIADTSVRQRARIDPASVLMSALGLVLVVFGMLQSKTWGWLVPIAPPVIGDVEIAPLGISLTAWLMTIGTAVLWAFVRRQRALAASGREPLVHVELFSIGSLRSGLSVLGAQTAVTAGVFFIVPVYLQMTLGLDALQTGLLIFPLSVSLILFSALGRVLARWWSPRRIVRVGQLTLVGSSLLLLGAVTADLRSALFSVGMFLAGAALGLLASQLGNVNMSSVGDEATSEVGGLQGVFQNLGSSLGTALIGSLLIATLSTTFAAGIDRSALPAELRDQIIAGADSGVPIVPAATVVELAAEAGLSGEEADELSAIYRDAQLSSLRVSLFGLLLISLAALVFSRGIPNVVARRPEGQGVAPPTGSGGRSGA